MYIVNVSKLRGYYLVECQSLSCKITEGKIDLDFLKVVYHAILYQKLERHVKMQLNSRVFYHFMNLNDGPMLMSKTELITWYKIFE